MVLQTIAGVPAQTIMDDYLLSNTYLQATNEKILAQISQALSPKVATNLEPALGVDASYMEAGLAQIASDYGTVDGYLTEGLGLKIGRETWRERVCQYISI